MTRKPQDRLEVVQPSKSDPPSLFGRKDVETIEEQMSREDREMFTKPQDYSVATGNPRVKVEITCTELPDALRRAVALRSISIERDRQQGLKARGQFKYSCADSEMNAMEKIAVMGEEFGEVCRAALEMASLSNDLHFGNAREALRAELVQLAACATAWVECIDREERERGV